MKIKNRSQHNQQPVPSMPERLRSDPVNGHPPPPCQSAAPSTRSMQVAAPLGN
jgi:hypothetical protein